MNKIQKLYAFDCEHDAEVVLFSDHTKAVGELRALHKKWKDRALELISIRNPHRYHEGMIEAYDEVLNAIAALENETLDNKEGEGK